MNLETKITIYKFTPQVFTLTLLFCLILADVFSENAISTLYLYLRTNLYKVQLWKII